MSVTLQQKNTDMLSKEEVLRIIAHCKDTGQSYKERCAELGVKIWQFHEAKAYYKRLEADSGSTGEFLQLRADGPMEPASITAFEGPAKERKSKKEGAATATRLQVEIIGRGGGTMRLYGDFTAETLTSLVKTL